MKNEDKGFEYSSINPGWIKKKIPNNYSDDNLKRIVLFYVINTPCTDLSSSGISLSDYGWDKKVWQNNVLKDKLFSVASLERGNNFVVAKNTREMKSSCEIAGMKKKFHQKRDVEKIVFYKPSRYNEFIAVLYHIRNAFAHGRLAIYAIQDSEDVMFALEDGVKDKNGFQIRSRMLLKKSTLLKWIDILEKKPTEEQDNGQA